MKEMIKKNFSKAAKNYERFASIQETSGRRLLKLYNLFNSPKPVLDLGAGTGKNLTGPKVVSLDIAFGMAKRCKERGNLSVCGNGEELPFKKGSFKAVFSNFTFQWTNIEKTLGEINRTLKKDGLLFVTVPVEGSLKILFESWKKASGKIPLFQFPQEEKVFKAVKTKFSIVTFERFVLKEKFSSAREALKRVTGIGAKNPFGRASFKEAKMFKKIFEENPTIEYRVLLIVARKL